MESQQGKRRRKFCLFTKPRPTIRLRAVQAPTAIPRYAEMHVTRFDGQARKGRGTLHRRKRSTPIARTPSRPGAFCILPLVRRSLLAPSVPMSFSSATLPRPAGLRCGSLGTQKSAMSPASLTPLVGESARSAQAGGSTHTLPRGLPRPSAALPAARQPNALAPLASPSPAGRRAAAARPVGRDLTVRAEGNLFSRVARIFKSYANAAGVRRGGSACRAAPLLLSYGRAPGAGCKLSAT